MAIGERSVAVAIGGGGERLGVARGLMVLLV